MAAVYCVEGFYPDQKKLLVEEIKEFGNRMGTL